MVDIKVLKIYKIHQYFAEVECVFNFQFNDSIALKSLNTIKILKPNCKNIVRFQYPKSGIYPIDIMVGNKILKTQYVTIEF